MKPLYGVSHLSFERPHDAGARCFLMTAKFDISLHELQKEANLLRVAVLSKDSSELELHLSDDFVPVVVSNMYQTDDILGDDTSIPQRVCSTSDAINHLDDH